MEQKQLEAIIKNAYTAGYMKCLDLIGRLPKISKNQAEKMYGYSKVKYWIENNDIKPIHSGGAKKSTIELSVFDLEMLNQREELRELNLKS